MNDQERDLELLLARTDRLLERYSAAEGASPSPLTELQALRDGLHRELTRCRARYFLETLRA